MRSLPWTVLTLVAASAACSTGDTCTDASCRAVAAQLVFNEVAGTGADFVELMNVGTTPVDVSGYAVADSNSDGGPRVDHAFRLPAMTVIAPGGFLLVMMESNCPAAREGTRCFRSESGISQGDGENIHLLDATDRVVSTVAYPPNGAPSGQSWGRAPGGTGAFRVMPRTPGYANEAP